MVNLTGIPKSCPHCDSHRGYAFAWRWVKRISKFRLVCTKCGKVVLVRDPDVIARQLTEGGF